MRLLMNRLALVFAVVMGLAAGTGVARAEKRVALVVGNSSYTSTMPLRTPANDAADVAGALDRLGFDVIRGIDLDYAGMRERVKLFSERLVGADVGLFYYGGHGIQVSGKNYLVPVDAKLNAASDLDFVAMDLDLVLRNMERETPTNIVFLDACRDNPLVANLAKSMGTRSTAITRGLARVESGVGTLIAFATQPGNVALDGTGRNSPFAAALLKVIERPGVPISDVMISVRRDVLRETENRQVPWDHSSLTGQFYFAAPTPAPAATAPTADPVQPNLELAFWDSIKNEKNPRLFEAYLGRYPNGVFAAIAKVVLQDVKAAAQQAADVAGDKLAISDPALVREARERLYELNFDPGPFDGPVGEPARRAIREFQQMSSLSPDGVMSQGLLRRLRETGKLKPWGAIVYARKMEKWGMAWSQDSRQAAVASARASCGSPAECALEISFFGTECGAFAHADASFAIVARKSIQQARDAALSDCGKRGRSCRVVAAVCADGADRTTQ
jgi:Caspase domain/Domain of unknown function (DUF4189)/Putative peptidoglycan binding domain